MYEMTGAREGDFEVEKSRDVFAFALPDLTSISFKGIL